ncbi:EAL and HDOD domain-containing protein [Salinimonas chungwhensis]|uniref:EAL and HDOD domain-containing protein n=1 Tax=Salinimonas chungwhensis TaxID=265425 RepID=UPI0003621373|nr:EAL domain-containing protein [Salinimonas chungwhensis]
MFAFIARQPILDRDKDVFAYELLFRDGKGGMFPDPPSDKAKSVIQQFNPLGLDDLSAEKKSFISFSAETLVSRFPTNLDPQQVVVELGENPYKDAGLREACEHIKQLGFRLALNDPMMLSGNHEVLPLVDIVKVDMSKLYLEQVSKRIDYFTDANVQLIADNVNDYDVFNDCKTLGFDFFQGYFFASPTARIARQLPASKMSLVELMGESSSETFDINRINQIIERDAALSYLLLKFINNPTINKRYKITSLKHALTYMGEVEIKKFIALLSLTHLGDDKPLELIHMSLVRAKFFDLVSQHRKRQTNPPIGFLVGLFSLLDALLDQDMASLVKQLPLTDTVIDALLGKSTEFNHYMALVRAFESALWMNVIKHSRALDTDQKLLHSLYNQAIVWGNSVRNTISSHYPKPRIA